VVRATFDRCVGSGGCSLATFYRQTSGSGWTTAQRVSQTTLSTARGAGVGFAGQIMVVYTGYTGALPNISFGNVFVRRASP
jgi:hypothetical protein